MKFGLQRKHGLLNSVSVFDAVSEGLQKLGHTVVNDTLDCDVPVLWSMLWHGRMKPKQTNIPIKYPNKRRTFYF